MLIHIPCLEERLLSNKPKSKDLIAAFVQTHGTGPFENGFITNAIARAYMRALVGSQFPLLEDCERGAYRIRNTGYELVISTPEGLDKFRAACIAHVDDIPVVFDIKCGNMRTYHGTMRDYFTNVKNGHPLLDTLFGKYGFAIMLAPEIQRKQAVQQFCAHGGSVLWLGRSSQQWSTALKAVANTAGINIYNGNVLNS